MIGDGKWIAQEFWVLLTIILGAFSVYVAAAFIGWIRSRMTTLNDSVIRLTAVVERLEKKIDAMEFDMQAMRSNPQRNRRSK
jgi:hypothetical protein